MSSTANSATNDEWMALVPLQLRARVAVTVLAPQSPLLSPFVDAVYFVSAPQEVREQNAAGTAIYRYGGTQNVNVARACLEVGWEVLTVLLINKGGGAAPDFGPLSLHEIRAFSDFWDAEKDWGRFDCEEVRPGEYHSLLMVTGNLRGWLQEFSKPELLDDRQPGFTKKVRERNVEQKMKISAILD